MDNLPNYRYVLLCLCIAIGTVIIFVVSLVLGATNFYEQEPEPTGITETMDVS